MRARTELSLGVPSPVSSLQATQATDLQNLLKNGMEGDVLRKDRIMVVVVCV